MLSVVNSLCVVWEKSLNWTQESEVCTAGCEFLKLCVKIWENGELFQEEEKLWNRTEIRERAVQEHKMSVSHINFKYVLDVNNTERTWTVCASIQTLLDKEQINIWTLRLCWTTFRSVWSGLWFCWFPCVIIVKWWCHQLRFKKKTNNNKNELNLFSSSYVWSLFLTVDNK